MWALPLIREDLSRRRTANLAGAEQQQPDTAPSLPAPFAGEYTQVHESSRLLACLVTGLAPQEVVWTAQTHHVIG